ncbi:uncharacterized protein LOC117516777 [Thalassophryne amazonica]|uniref:uncharacterized protein LOC117516777 n=1 Tax=Thalassophryne amazonica TaxID=390379 RepID=UPI001470D9D0|nr:uncharacterized protein LOC117516777 [Thalassophryne amazonica]
MSIDSNYVWQRRVHYGMWNQKGAVPFPDSSEIGVEFHVAFERKEKLDSSLLTNGVVLDICDFAKAVTRSEKYIMYEIMEFNFDFDVESEEQRADFAARICTKAKLMRDQVKTKFNRWKDKFVLPELRSVKTSAGSEQSGQKWPRIGKIHRDEGSVNDGAECKELSIMKPGGRRVKLTEELYPFCKAAGLRLVVQEELRKEKLSLDLLTNGAMMEVVAFTRVICSSRGRIIQEVVTHNFDVTFGGTYCNIQIDKVLQRVHLCHSAEAKAALRKEPFKTQPVQDRPRFLKKRLAEVEQLKEDVKRIVMPQQVESEGNAAWQDIEMSYMCPVDFEMEVQSGSELRPRNILSGAAASVKSLDSLDVKPKEEFFISPVDTKTGAPPTTAELLSAVFSGDSDETANAKTMKQRLWVRRSPRSKEILGCSRVNDMFKRCRNIGFDFNVGSGRKQNLDLRLLSNGVLFEVYKFASALRKTIHKFLFAILDNNFNLVIQGEVHRRNFLIYFITKEKVIQNYPGRKMDKFLSSSFQLPEVYNMVDVTSEFLPENVAMSEEPEVTVSQQTSPETHPYCKKLGIDLWLTEERPLSEKLELTVLTNGAVLEIVGFVKDLCGTVWEIVSDLLEHNFNLDLKNTSSNAARVILKWHATHKVWMRRPGTSAVMIKWLNQSVLWDTPSNKTCLAQPELPAESAEDKEEPPSKPDWGPTCGNVERGKAAEQSSYRICNEIGLDLDIHSRSKSKAKLDLGVLTRGVLFEMHRYVGLNCNRYVPALYEILEYNFDLSSQCHRKVEFAWSVASQVIAMVGKQRCSLIGKGEYLNKVFELPFEISASAELICKEEPENDHAHLDGGDDVMFVRELKPVDIEVEVE